jgi:hypothetical protein
MPPLALVKDKQATPTPNSVLEQAANEMRKKLQENRLID